MLYFTKFCVSSICVVLYKLSQIMASECSTSHLTPHLYWFLCTRTGFRHRPWNSLVLYLGEFIAVQPVSTRQLALDFTSCYRFSPYYIHMSKFYIPTFGSHRNNSITAPISLYFVPSPQTGIDHVIAIFSAVNTCCRRHQLSGARARDSSSLFHILTSFVHGGVLSVCSPPRTPF